MADVCKSLKPKISACSPPPYDFGSFTDFENSGGESIQIPEDSNAQQVLKLRKWMNCLVVIEFALSVVALAFGSACSAVTYVYARQFYFEPCFEATGVWVSVLCLVTAGFGIAAFNVPTDRRCLLMAHFVLLIISMVACVVLIVFSSFWIVICYESSRMGHGLVFNASLLIVSSALLILYIASITLVGYNWSSGRSSQEPNLVIVYQRCPDNETPRASYQAGPLLTT